MILLLLDKLPYQLYRDTAPDETYSWLCRLWQQSCLLTAMPRARRSFIVGQKQVSEPSFSQHLTDLDEI